MSEIVMGKDYPKSLEEFKKIVKDTTRDDLVQGLYDISQQAIHFQEQIKSLKTNIKTKKRNRKHESAAKRKYKRRLDMAIEFVKENSLNVNGEYTFIHIGTDGKELLDILEGEVK